MRIRAIALLISVYCIPAFYTGCSLEDDGISREQDRHNVVLLCKKDASSATLSEIRHSDIFIFNDNPLKRLDSYQHSEGGGPVKAASRRGDKIMVAIANAPMPSDGWRSVNSYEGIQEEISLLQNEDPECPVMSGEAMISSGSDEMHYVEMERLVSEIRINSIRTDFSGREYDGEPLTDVRIYLTNVNASCKYLKKDGFSPEMIVNPGFLDMDALSGFKDRSLLYADTEDIGEETLYPGIKLFCYPNDSPEETPGSPFTRLVIEGKISGHTYWYPVTINRGDFGIASGGDGKGIGRNMCYTYDFTILRTGTSDPDIPVCKDDISVTCMVEPWKEMENETVTF